MIYTALLGQKECYRGRLFAGSRLVAKEEAISNYNPLSLSSGLEERWENSKKGAIALKQLTFALHRLLTQRRPDVENWLASIAAIDATLVCENYYQPAVEEWLKANTALWGGHSVERELVRRSVCRKCEQPVSIPGLDHHYCDHCGWVATGIL